MRLYQTTEKDENKYLKSIGEVLLTIWQDRFLRKILLIDLLIVILIVNLDDFIQFMYWLMEI